MRTRFCVINTMLVTAVILIAAAGGVLPAKVFNALKYGVTPNDDMDDDADAIRAILQRMQAGDKLYLPKGRYDISSSIIISRKKKIEIFGRNSTIVVHGFGRRAHKAFQPVEIIASQGVTIRDLTFTMDPAPYATGVVKRVGDGKTNIDIVFDATSPVSQTDPLFAYLTLYPGTTIPTGQARRIQQLVRKRILLDAHTLSITFQQPLADLNAGDRIVILHRYRTESIIYLRNATGVNLSNITISASPSSAVFASNCNGIKLYRVKITPDPDNPNALFSALSDAVVFANCRGVITISDCDIKNINGNAFTIFGPYLSVIHVNPATNTVTLDQNNRPPVYSISTGESVTFSGSDLREKRSARVVKMDIEPSHPGRIKLTLTALPKNVTAGDVMSLDSLAPKVRFQNNRITNCGGAGINVAGRNIEIYKNTISFCSGPGIVISSDIATRYRGTPSMGAKILKNTVENCNNGVRRRQAAILVEAITGTRSALKSAPAGAHNKMTISQNTIRNTAHSAIYVSSTQDVTIVKNTIATCSVSKTDSQTNASNQAIYLFNCDTASVSGNSLLKGKYGVGFNAGSENITVSDDNTGFTSPGE